MRIPKIAILVNAMLCLPVFLTSSLYAAEDWAHLGGKEQGLNYDIYIKEPRMTDSFDRIFELRHKIVPFDQETRLEYMAVDTAIGCQFKESKSGNGEFVYKDGEITPIKAEPWQPIIPGSTVEVIFDEVCKLRIPLRRPDRWKEIGENVFIDKNTLRPASEANKEYYAWYRFPYQDTEKRELLAWVNANCSQRISMRVFEVYHNGDIQEYVHKKPITAVPGVNLKQIATAVGQIEKYARDYVCKKLDQDKYYMMHAVQK